MKKHGFLLSLMSFVPLAAGTLAVSIQDERGTEVAARVYVVNSRGAAYFPDHAIRYDKVRPDGIAERHFVPPNGRFSLQLSQGDYRVTVERGKEYRPWTIQVAMPAVGERKLRVRLERLFDMPKRGWYSGDMHVHRPLADLAVLMDAEDLALAVPITRWKTNQKQNEDSDLNRFLAAADKDGVMRAAPGRYFPVLNEELEPRASALLASWLRRTPIALEYPLASFGQSVSRAGGVSDAEKATSLELPALAALNAFQTLGLVNNHIWRLASFSGAWGAWPDRMLREYPNTCAGFVQSGFDMYAALLSVGIPVQLSAGSASGVHPVPPGWSRVYVRTGEAMSARAWYAGLRAGRSFVTTGPMLFLSINGKEPGDAIRGEQFPLLLHASLEMLSTVAVAQAEIVMNGAVHPVRLVKAPGDGYAYRGSLDLTAETSTWVAARWVESRGSTCDAAHSSPVYVWKGTQPIPFSRANAALLLNRVDRLIADVSSGRDLNGFIAVNSPELRTATLDYLQRARQVYLAKIEGSR